MLYLYGRDNDKLEPVIPSFPVVDENSFTGLNTWRGYSYAELKIMKEDPDDLLQKLIDQYPALPRTLLENYIMIPMMKLSSKAAPYSVGDVFQIFTTEDIASLRQTTSGEMIRLWDSQPIKEIK